MAKKKRKRKEEGGKGKEKEKERKGAELPLKTPVFVYSIFADLQRQSIFV